MEKLNDLLEQLAAARAIQQLHKEARQGMERQLAQDPVYRMEKEEEARAEMIADELRGKIEQIRDETHPAVTWKTYKYIEYDEDAVTEWCFENLKVALVLDSKVFEDIAAKLPDEPGVFEHKTEERMSISSDLTRFIL